MYASLSLNELTFNKMNHFEFLYPNVGRHLKSVYNFLNLRAIKILTLYKNHILWNPTQNTLPIHWRLCICISFRGGNLRALRFKHVWNFPRTELFSCSATRCKVCRQTTKQHLLAKCDSCHQHYHLGCLDPPLTRMPKKTKMLAW